MLEIRLIWNLSPCRVTPCPIKKHDQLFGKVIVYLFVMPTTKILVGSTLQTLIPFFHCGCSATKMESLYEYFPFPWNTINCSAKSSYISLCCEKPKYWSAPPSKHWSPFFSFLLLGNEDEKLIRVFPFFGLPELYPIFHWIGLYYEYCRPTLTAPDPRHIWMRDLFPFYYETTLSTCVCVCVCVFWRNRRTLRFGRFCNVS